MESKPTKRIVKVKRSSKKTKENDSDATESAAVPMNVMVSTAEEVDDRPTCGVCIEPYNRVANTEVACCFCHKSACRRCIQTFLKTTTNDPHCMHCNKAWDREFIDDNLTATYRMNDYKKHRENVLLDRETALMPATQYRAEQIRSADKMEKEMITPLDGQLKELYKESGKIHAEITRIGNLRGDALYQIRQLRTGKGEKAKNEISFVRKCPDGDCRGFLSTAWKCGLCSKWACPECHEIKGESRESPHTCNPDNVETAKLLAKDSRPCPGCGTIITKIEGCDQMWCPQCHTPFSWRTGRKETGVVHNPHYYEWQRKNGGGVAPRVPGDIPCGGIPSYREISIGTKGMDTKKEVPYLNMFHRTLNHVEQYTLPRYHNVFNEADNEDMRIDYLLGRISSDELKVIVQQREKKREKERALRRAGEVLVQAGTDVLRRLITEPDISKKRAIMEELDSLRIYVNGLYAKIHERLKLSVVQYKSDWAEHFPFSPSAKKRELEEIAKAAAQQRAVLAPTQTPVAPTQTPVAPTQTPVAPTQTPVGLVPPPPMDPQRLQ